MLRRSSPPSSSWACTPSRSWNGSSRPWTASSSATRTERPSCHRVDETDEPGRTADERPRPAAPGGSSRRRSTGSARPPDHPLRRRPARHPAVVRAAAGRPARISAARHPDHDRSRRGLLRGALVLWYDVRDDGPRSVVADAFELDGFTLLFTMLVSATVVLTATALLRGAEPLRARRARCCSATGAVVMAWRTTSSCCSSASRRFDRPLRDGGQHLRAPGPRRRP